ncbi:MAG: NUDIX domain-containing protein, partial [Deltaproteobacteria bacterium]|nr:NUDIX domain-containing protein [Deltaproteobacteria bacterium]
CLEEGETPEAALVREVAEETELPVSVRDKLAVIRHSYTTCRVTMHAFSCNLLDTDKQPVLHAAVEGKWILPSETADYAFPAGHRKLLDRLGWGREAKGGSPSSPVPA